MRTFQKNEAGFSAVEAVLIIIVIAVLGFSGWYVWHNKQANSKKPTTQTTSKTTTPAIPAAKANTFKIVELGIQLVNVPDSINDLTDHQYASNTAVDPNNTVTTPVKFTAVQFSTDSLTATDPDCSATDGTGIGALARSEGTYVQNEDEDNTAFVKQFNGFYITYGHPEAACSNKDAPEALHISQTSIFETLIKDPANVQLLQ